MQLNEQVAIENQDLVKSSEISLDTFLASVERRAYRTAMMSTRKSADALDIVQDAMTKLVEHYRERPSLEWPLLFQRILQHRIMDWHRQQQRQKKWFWQSKEESEDDTEDLIHSVVDEREQNPMELLVRANDVRILIAALEQLPLRQRQAFLLRAWEGFDVAQTALSMECSEGSVKTHYFRALQSLKVQLLKSEE